jgi:hypothetical protein
MDISLPNLRMILKNHGIPDERIIDFKHIQVLSIEEAKNVETLLPHFVRVTDVDDSPDLTDIHPKDRKDLDLFFIPVDNKLFPKT